MKELVSIVKFYGGAVTSITPKQLLDTEGYNSLIDEQIVVESMGERKYKMHEYSDAFIAFPGGLERLKSLWSKSHGGN
jgi:predicted Rossmann-fold nucleotide-binding protein